MNKACIKEIFTSIQGEGLYAGEMQIFVRFCSCNLNCKYCDTDFKKDKKSVSYTSETLAEKLIHKEVSTVSLTGGEPLLETKFLLEFLPLIRNHKKVYLETNGTLTNELAQIIDYVDVVSADIKLKSATKQQNRFLINDEFMSVASKKECFIKVVFDENIEKNEIEQVVKIAKKYDLPIVLQPMMRKNSFCIKPEKAFEILKIFYKLYSNTRLIPQLHKFLEIL
ncbi:7-carboxy-7-deazaguanine synthase QueE [bacterium]|nr:7-carboxy-7-deazaguanine synthase QueE [bacterium]